MYCKTSTYFLWIMTFFQCFMRMVVQQKEKHMSLVLDCDVIFHESVCKVQISWEGHKIQKNFSHYIWHYLVMSNKLGDFFKILWRSQNIWTLKCAAFRSKHRPGSLNDIRNQQIFPLGDWLAAASSFTISLQLNGYA